jgi:formate dehydrogenase major subunit
MSDHIFVTLDNQTFQTKAGQTILEFALSQGIYIPHLCHHPDLKPAGVCRLCGVEVEGRGMVMSCNTPITEGMAIRTRSEKVDSVRKIGMELLFSDHPADCFTCAANNDCELLRIANYLNLDRSNLKQYRNSGKHFPVDSSNPFFEFDANKCVLCGICVRTCNEIQGVRAIDFLQRGYVTKVGTYGDQPFIESTCESCGECVERCPVGALVRKNYRQPSYEVETICSYCGVGCGLLVGVQGNEIVNVRGNPDNPTNRGQLCVKGRFGYRFVNHPDRLTKPLVRQYLLDGKKKADLEDGLGEWVEVDWDTATSIVAKRFVEIKTKFGPDAIGVLASAKCTNEENYLFQKFARQVIGTHSIDHCARL